jgi:hypothetical protein
MAWIFISQCAISFDPGFHSTLILKIKLKHWWTTIPPMWTKWTITFHLKLLNMNKTTIYDVENPGPGLGQAHTRGVVKPVNGITNSLILIFSLVVTYLKKKSLKVTIYTHRLQTKPNHVLYCVTWLLLLSETTGARGMDSPLPFFLTFCLQIYFQ